LVQSGLSVVQEKIILEWTNYPKSLSEQRAICSCAIIASSLASLGFASSLGGAMAVSVSGFFSLICAFLGAGCYTLWFAENDRGAWRLVDNEGRELLRVSG